MAADGWIGRVADPREIAPDHDVVDTQALAKHLETHGAPALLFGGDVMLGGRSSKIIAQAGADALFDGVRPLLERVRLVCVNLEGPIAQKASKLERNHSYKVHPSTRMALQNANIGVVTLANNHLTDCGREGVVETLEFLEAAGIEPLGAGRNSTEAHVPFFFQEGDLRIGLLNYYWNRRTAATGRLPGSARATDETLRRDIPAAKAACDRLVVIFHWGLPYVAEPFEQDQAHARLAVDLGADLIVGHHPHVIQRLEVYQGVPIFYSLGNFAFGSGNSKGQGMLLGATFRGEDTHLVVYPLYVKNRDPRVAYRPRLLRGESAAYVLSLLESGSGDRAHRFAQRDVGATLTVARRRHHLGLASA